MGGVGAGAQPTLLGAGLTLRPWGETDIDQVHSAGQDPAIQRWTTLPSPYTRDDAVEFVTDIAPGQWSDRRGAHFAVLSDDGPELLGACGLSSIDPARSSAEAGYWVTPAARGRAVASTALALVVDWARDGLGLAVLDLLAAEANHASRAVAEAAGFTLAGPCPADRCPLDEPVVLYTRMA